MRGNLEDHGGRLWHEHCWRLHMVERDDETLEHLRDLRDGRDWTDRARVAAGIAWARAAGVRTVVVEVTT
jgi:hypothetical protein